MALTHWRTKSDGQVDTRKESERVRETHELEGTVRRKSEDTEKKRASERHSHPGERRATDKSGYGRQARKREALTCWRQSNGRVKLRKESERGRGAHILESAEQQTNVDTE
jgi:hypothetical protein